MSLLKRIFGNSKKENEDNQDFKILEHDALSAKNESEFISIIQKIDRLDVVLRILLDILDKDIGLCKKRTKAMYLIVITLIFQILF